MLVLLHNLHPLALFEVARIARHDRVVFCQAGQYLDFVGGQVDDEMILDRTVTRADGSFVRQRMRWWGIASDTFSWDWLRASDASTEWELNWRLRYTRVTAVTQARADVARYERIRRRSSDRTSP